MILLNMFVVFSDENAKGTVKVDIKCGAPFEPVNVYKMLQAIDFEAFKVRSLICCTIAYHSQSCMSLILLCFVVGGEM